MKNTVRWLAAITASFLIASESSSGQTLPLAKASGGSGSDLATRAMPPVKAPKNPARPEAPQVPVSDYARFVFENLLIAASEIKHPLLQKNQAAFDEIRKYFSNSYGGVKPSKSLAYNGETYDCIPIDQQPTLRTGEVKLDTPPDASNPAPAAPIFGANDATCSPGEIPRKRISINEIAQFGSLANFLAKDRGISDNLHSMNHNFTPPDKKEHVPKPQAGGIVANDGHIHRYAIIYDQAQLTGLTASLNIWSPKVPSSEMSLSQTWIVGDSNNGTQTLESGWQVRSDWNGGLVSPFIYSTQDGYNSTGCYNLDCVGFVQVTNQVVFGPFPSSLISSVNGQQSTLDIEWRKSKKSGNWWLKLNGVWVGYYPATLFSGGTLSSGTSKLMVEFGGENTGAIANAEMGSGKFGSLGFGVSAFQGNLQYIDLAGNYQSTNGAPYVTDPQCYTVVPASPSPPNSEHHISFYFGGPGIADQACATAEQTAN